MPREKIPASTSVKKLRARKFLRVTAAVLIALAVLGASGYWLFVGWRARDLALKARTNLEHANYRLAWLQAASAQDLRPDEPEVLRTSAVIDAAFGRKESLEAWRRLAATQPLSTDDEERRARAAIRFGDEEQLEAAVTALDKAGQKEAVARLRTMSKLSRGDLEEAVEEARRGASFSDDPRLRLDLARLLLRRYVDDLAASPAQGSPALRAFSEMTAIVNSLQDDPSFGKQALAFGLTYLLPGLEVQKVWAAKAMSQATPDNPALLPAATVLADNKLETVAELHGRLRPVFDAAPLERRAAYAAWLTRQGMPREALTLITVKEAGEGTMPFLARVEALGALGNWEGVIAATDAGGNMPESVRLLSRARAEYALRAGASSGAKSAADALRSAAREGNLLAAMQTADGFGARTAVDDALVGLCADPAVAGAAFRVARERFGTSGDHARLEAAYANARAAGPAAVPVVDYGRYVALLDADNKSFDLEAAEEAAVAEPADSLVRITAALARLRAGKNAEALASFDDITVFYDRLPPGPQAVICAVLASGGRRDQAASLARSIDKAKLTPAEATLIEGVR